MDMSNILIFVLIGAVCLVVVTGGFLSMTDTEVSPGYLAAGAALGGAAGALFGPSIGGEGSTGSSAVSVLGDAGKLLTTLTGGGGVPEMKVGLPAF
jgi:hypothetical protein